MKTKMIMTALMLVTSVNAFARQSTKVTDTDPQFCQEVRAEALVDCQDIYRARGHIKACVFDTVSERVATFNAETADLSGGGQVQCSAE
ncbi:hypothetical protein [Bdellovibrio sp. HCB337]|uniref:hypothetical protein n=1 Tax=Bdellovibrio sp. HCB337 TaxID=3394358 RepID=UPI0039A637FE